MLRPERIRLLSRQDDLARQSISGKIEDFVYLGEDVQLKIVTVGGEQLLITLKGGKSINRLRVGDTGEFSVDEDDIHILANDRP